MAAENGARKVIKQGNNTLTITLPKKWTEKFNINAGDEIDLFERDGTLVLKGTQREKEKYAEFDITNLTVPMFWRFFQSAYRSGCNEIKVTFDPSKKYEDAYHYYTTLFDYSKLGEKILPKPAVVIVQEIVNRFIGFELVEASENYCIIREMGEISMKEFDNSMRRIFLVIMQMFDRLREAIEKNQIKDSSLCKEIHTIDLTVDKFVDYCSRIMNKANNFPNESKKPLIFSTLFLLELIGDECKYVGKHIALSKKPVKDILGFLKEVKGHFELYYHMYYKFSHALAVEFGNRDVQLYEKHVEMRTRLTDESFSILRHLMMISKFTLALVELRTEMEY